MALCCIPRNPPNIAHKARHLCSICLGEIFGFFDNAFQKEIIIVVAGRNFQYVGAFVKFILGNDQVIGENTALEELDIVDPNA